MRFFNDLPQKQQKRHLEQLYSKNIWTIGGKTDSSTTVPPQPPFHIDPVTVPDIRPFTDSHYPETKDDWRSLSGWDLGLLRKPLQPYQLTYIPDLAFAPRHHRQRGQKAPSKLSEILMKLKQKNQKAQKWRFGETNYLFELLYAFSPSLTSLTDFFLEYKTPNQIVTFINTLGRTHHNLQFLSPLLSQPQIQVQTTATTALLSNFLLLPFLASPPLICSRCRCECHTLDSTVADSVLSALSTLLRQHKELQDYLSRFLPRPSDNASSTPHRKQTGGRGRRGQSILDGDEREHDLRHSRPRRCNADDLYFPQWHWNIPRRR